MKLSDFSEHRREIFALYDKNEFAVNEDIRILREWISKSPHLPSKLIQDQLLELLLLKNKFSIEKCKSKIEMYCSLKAHPQYEYIYQRIPVPGKEPAFITGLPILTDEYKRVLVWKIYDEKTYEMAVDINCSAIMREFLLRYDYNDGEILILDMRNCSLSIMSKFRMNIFVDTLHLILQGYSARISAIHVVTKIGKTIFSTITPLLPKKLASRLNFHANIDTLQDVISPKYLPSDYGGELQSLDNFNEEWKEIFEENLQQIEEFVKTKSREELRLDGDPKNEEMKGTFKKLNID